MGHAMVSDWTAGSTYVWDQDGLNIEHSDQTILESDPYRRLVLTFHTFVHVNRARRSRSTSSRAAIR
jgi:hypothetical protein